MWPYFWLFLLVIRLLSQSRRDRVLENLILRQQLAVSERRARRPPLRDPDRRFWSTLARHWDPWRAHLVVVRDRVGGGRSLRTASEPGPPCLRRRAGALDSGRRWAPRPTKDENTPRVDGGARQC